MNGSLTPLHPRVLRRDQRRFISSYIYRLVEKIKRGYQITRMRAQLLTISVDQCQ